MPNEKGELSQEEREQILKFLTEKQAVATNCPMCGWTQWDINGNLAIVPIFNGTNVILGVGYPAVVITCGRCSYFRFHAANPIGIGRKTDDEAKPGKQEGEVKHGA